MRRAVYRQVAALLRSIPSGAWPHVELIADHFDVSAEAVISIYSQEAQQYIVRNLPRLRAGYEEQARRYCAGEDVLEQAFRLNFAPCIVIRGHLLTLLGLSKQRATDVLKEPALLRGCCPPLPAAAHPAVTPQLLGRLEADIARCVAADWLQAPAMDAVRHNAGLEGEAALCGALAAAGVPFWSEESLREQDYIKTPDVLLQVPVATQSGKIICWIDSKATFGDELQHRLQTKEQYSKYVNRYGPGAVIYWAGYVTELEREAAAEHLVLLTDVPTDLIQLPRLEL